MSSTRSVISPPPFAENALTVIPPTPVAGVSYRDPVAGPASSQDGWPYAERVNSAEFNQIMFQLSTLLGIMDKKGVLGWSSAVDYTEAAITIGSNGAIYTWVAASGPNNGGAKDPISNPANWALFGAPRISRFTANGSFTVPAGVTTIYVTAVGGGAGGGGSGDNNIGNGPTGSCGSGGGAGQSVIRLPVTVTPGATLAVVIGAGGAAGGGSSQGSNNATPGGSGGTTSLGGSLVALNGGSSGLGGEAANASGRNGPSGGAGFPNGGPGSDGAAAASANGWVGTGGSGGSSPFGGGGAGGKSGFNIANATGGSSGFGFGSGGGGGAVVYSTGGNGRNGGSGTPGLMIIEW